MSHLINLFVGTMVLERKDRQDIVYHKGKRRYSVSPSMSSMGELTFFLGLQVQQKKDGIFISQDKYVAEILKKFGFIKVKTASTPMETQKAFCSKWWKMEKVVDVNMYRLMTLATVKAKTVNGEVQLQALVDGKKTIITESTVRRDLQLEDAEGVDCLPNATIFE
ncbi:uncharacterized mitochondrial protein-like protein [Tanacetum coccineum]